MFTRCFFAETTTRLFFQAFSEVEISVRNAAALGNDRLGCALAREAFSPKNGPLIDAQAIPGGQTALMELFAGVIGYFKNPGSHREVELSAIEAAEATMLAGDRSGLWMIGLRNPLYS